MKNIVYKLTYALGCNLVFLMLLMLASMLPAFAYLDPTAGSIIIQAVAGTLLAAGLLVKGYWRWIKVKLGLSQKEPL